MNVWTCMRWVKVNQSHLGLYDRYASISSQDGRSDRVASLERIDLYRG